MSGESTATGSSTQGGPPNRPLPPTPDDDAQGDRTLIMKRVSEISSKKCLFCFQQHYHHLCSMFREKNHKNCIRISRRIS